jgi:AbrB family looped-hinge helix DNA binding protein
MKVGPRGQVTIPKHIRQKFGIDANTQVEFHEVDGKIVLKKVPVKIGIRKWRGKCADVFAKQGFFSVDRFMNASRGPR